MKRIVSILLVAMLCLAVAAPLTSASAADQKVLRYGTNSLKGAFNPILSADVYDSYVTSLIFQGLVGNDENLNMIYDENCVAEKCDISEDKLTYTFTIRKGLVFSNGDPLTASDVAFTFKMIGSKDYDGVRASVVADMVGYEAYHDGTAEDFEGIKVTDDHTISFTLKEPYVAKLEELSSYGILCEEYYTKASYDEFKALNGAPVGSGPFMLDSFDPAQACNMVANPNWGGKKPALDGVTILIIPSDTQIMALVSGQVDLIQAPGANLDNMAAMKDGGANVIQFTGLGYNAMMLNHQSPKLADVKVRQALMYGFDRASFVANEWEGFAAPCLAPVYPKFWAWPKDESNLNRYEYDPQKAKDLLAEAGWKDTNGDGTVDKDGVEMVLKLNIYPEAPWPGNLSAVLAEQWPLIGVGLEVANNDFNSVMDAAYEQRAFDKFDMWTQGWSLSSDPDPTALFGKVAYESKGGFNPGGYINEHANELFAAGRQEYDRERRAAIIAEWVAISNEELPMLFNAVRDELWGVAPNVTGFDKLNPFYTWASCILDVDIK